MRIEYKHNLGREQAYEKLEGIKGVLLGKYSRLVSGYDYTWSDDHGRMDFTITAKGITTEGSLELDDNNLVLEGKIPWAVKLLFSEGRLEEIAREQLDRLFAGEPPDFELKKLGL